MSLSRKFRLRATFFPLVLVSGAASQGLLAQEAPVAVGDQVKPPVREAGAERWVTTDDYPDEAINQGESGIVAVDLTISPAGRVTACRVTTSSRSASLDETTCYLLTQRARFSPARDSRDAPVQGHIPWRVDWRLPWTTVVGMAGNATTINGWIARTHITAGGVMDQCWVVSLRDGSPVERDQAAVQEAICAQVRNSWTQARDRPDSRRSRWVEWRNLQAYYPGESPWPVPPNVDARRP